MARTKSSTSVVVVVAVLLAVAGTVFLTFKIIDVCREKAREKAVWASVTHVVDVVTQSAQPLSPSDIKAVQSVSDMVSIRPTQFASQIDDGLLQGTGSRIMLGVAVSAGELFARAYGINRVRIVNPEALPPGKYDFVMNVTNRQKEVLQAAIKKKFGLTAMRVTRETNVLALTVASAGRPGLQPGSRGSYQPERFFGKGTPTDGHLLYHNHDLNGFALLLEHQLGIPVLNQTGLTDLYNIQLDDNQAPDLQTANQFLLDQLGLRLTPATRTIDMLMVEKAK